MKTQKQLILSENLWKVMWKLSWPAMIAMVMFGLNLFFDAIFVGTFIGEEALAGVAVAYPIASLAMGFGSLIGVGAGSILSIALGENDLPKQNQLLGNVNFLTLLLSAIYMILGLLFSRALVSMMGAEGEALSFGDTYFSITVIGAFFWIYGFAANMVIRAEGKMKRAALIMGIGLVINIFFNFLFVVVFEWGVPGVAWASNIGMVVYSALGLFYFMSKKTSFKSNPFSLMRNSKIIKEIVSLGMASFIMVSMSLVQAVVVYNSISRYGSVFETAFYGAAFRIMNLMIMPVVGVMRALQPTIGINFGAQQIDRVVKSFWVFTIASTAIILPIWAVVMLMPKEILGTMIDTQLLTDSHIINFRIFMGVIPMLPLIFMTFTFFPAIGKGKPSNVMGILRQVVFYIPAMLILPAFWGVKWIYIGSTLIDVSLTSVAIVLVLIEFNRLTKTENPVIKFTTNPT